MLRKIVCMGALSFMAGAGVAADYEWTGGAGNGDWDDKGNWEVTGDDAKYGTPTAQYRHPNTNQDCGKILICDGELKSKSWIGVDGKRDGSTTAEMIFDGADFSVPSLTVAQYPGVKGKVVVKNSKLKLTDHLRICFDGKKPSRPTVGTMVLSGKSTKIEVGGNFYMNDGGTGKMTSSLLLKRGAIIVEKNLYVNDDAKNGSSAEITIKGGLLKVKGEVDAPFITDGKATVNVLGGTLEIGDALYLGKRGGDTGSSVFTIDGGEVVAGNLLFKMKNAKIVIKQGTLKVKSEKISSDAMRNLLTEKRIVLEKGKEPSITEEDEYTVLKVK